MRRCYWVVLSLTLLSVFVLGLAVEQETGIFGRIIGGFGDVSAEVQPTGRLPLEDWELTWPATYNKFGEGEWWYHGSGDTTLAHWVGRIDEGIPAEALELEFFVPWYVMDGSQNFQIEIEAWYVEEGGGGPIKEVGTITSQQLAALARESDQPFPTEGMVGRTVQLTFPLDSELNVDQIKLMASCPNGFRVFFKAELILR